MIDYTKIRTGKRVERFRNVLEKRQRDISIVLENINDPHNLSAVLRSCDAVGILEINAVYHGGQPLPKLGRQSSASAKKWVKQRYFNRIEVCFDLLRSEGKKIYTTKMDIDSIPLYDLDLTKPVALVFGNEHDGISDRAAELADGNFLIPQVGMIQSLNISVACAVCLYEAFRQRLVEGMYDEPSLEREDIERILQEWLAK